MLEAVSGQFHCKATIYTPKVLKFYGIFFFWAVAAFDLFKIKLCCCQNNIYSLMMMCILLIWDTKVYDRISTGAGFFFSFNSSLRRFMGI